MEIIIALILTLIAGASMMIGEAIVYKTKDKNKITIFSIGIALAVMLFLLGFDLIPEVIEMMESSNWTVYLFIALLGLIVAKVLDPLVPHHHGDECGHNHALEEHLYHIGLVSMIAILMHNIIEGMAIYGLVETSIQAGVLFTLSIVLHNIPLGMAISSTLHRANASWKKTTIQMIVTSLASFFGGLMMFLINTTTYKDTIFSFLLALTVGTIIYIVAFEFIPVAYENRREKTIYNGLIVGTLLSLLMLLF